VKASSFSFRTPSFILMDSDPASIVVALMAIYAAGLSTVIAILKILENRPKIVIDYDYYDPDHAELYLVLIVENHGKKSITLSYAAIKEEKPKTDRQGIAEPDRNVDGIEIKSGKNCKIPFTIRQIPEKWLKTKMQFVGILRDQLGNEYRSKIIDREAF
jgi:hypothetical protein